jgi:cytochrome P450
LKKFQVTNNAGCHAVEQDQRTFSANISGATTTRAIGAQPMLRMDDPEHAADRAPVNPVLRPKSIMEVWGPVFERNAEIYLGKVAELGPEEADLNRDYAAPVASQNLIDLLGLKDAVNNLREIQRRQTGGRHLAICTPTVTRWDEGHGTSRRLKASGFPHFGLSIRGVHRYGMPPSADVSEICRRAEDGPLPRLATASFPSVP